MVNAVVAVRLAVGISLKIVTERRRREIQENLISTSTICDEHVDISLLYLGAVRSNHTVCLAVSGFLLSNCRLFSPLNLAISSSTSSNMRLVLLKITQSLERFIQYPTSR